MTPRSIVLARTVSIAALTMLAACGGSNARPTPRSADRAAPPRVGPEAMQGFAVSANAFAFDLFGRLRVRPGNLVFSPASVALALDMTYAGARGETAAQMAATLHVAPDASRATHETHENAAAALASWDDPARESYQLFVANRLFGEETYSFHDDFLTLTRDLYGAELEPVDFRGHADRSRERINDWVEEQTHDRITDLLPSGSITADTRLVLTNAVYFLARWQSEFEQAGTYPAAFTAVGGRAVQVPTMHQTTQYAYADAGDVRLLQLPYRDEEIGMVVLLPREPDGLAALETQINAEQLAAWLATLATQRVELSLPKYRLAPAESIGLSQELQALGMTDAFSDERADFTGMADFPPERRLYISDVFHKAFVEVDERGTEAAAATAVVMEEAAAVALPEDNIVFNVDHPFLFLIRDLRSGAILFLGRVADPSAS
jgi:serpin B